MAKRPSHELAFTALRIEGGLLATDFLDKIAHLGATEQSEADYDIPRGLKLRDEIGRYWKIAQNLWNDFNTARGRTDLDAHKLTVQDFLEPLCRQVLGMADLKAVGQVILDERIFPIGYAALDGRLPTVFAAHNRELDKPSSKHGDGTRRRSPFLLAQEYLNADEHCLWAVVSNGLKLRILRDNPSLTRPAYIEADLEAIFTEGLYPDFTALWLLAHGTRFGKPGAEPAECPLERWRNTAQEEGIRIRDRLRNGVTEALRSLGTGFLALAANGSLRQKLETGELSTQALFEQLLRLVYRFIFLATIEDRELVFSPDASPEAKQRYQAGYSLARLRNLAARRRSYDRHSDLWQVLTITFVGLGKGQPALGLPALGGLFDARQCPDLDGAQLDNHSLLSALFSLCFFREDAALSRVNYRDMDSEELGSVYESLLELVPVVTLSGGARRFGFVGDDEVVSTKGHARKLTGSYYTPDSLVQELIKSALEPVIEQTLKANPQAPVQALLELTVCDPACGSGHFLLAAARRIAEEVARLSAADGNPTPEDYRHALREVVAHCVYGVDKNPMAIELARTALWLEAYTPDRPLTFLEHHLRCGDALLGVLDPAILAEGIPDKAFDVLAGDDKDVVKALKKANREARKSIEKIRKNGPQHELALTSAASAIDLDALPDDTLEDIEALRRAFAETEAAAAHSRERIAADLFVAAFVLSKNKATQSTVPTSQDLYLQLTGNAPRPGVVEVATHAAQKAQAFHWWQAYRHIKEKGGFDVLLGNPPWDVSQISEDEYFSSRAPSIAAMRGEQRKQAIVALENDNRRLWEEYVYDRHRVGASNSFFRESDRFPLSTFGKLNTYSLFAETFFQLMSQRGRAGFIVPSGLGTDDSNKKFFQNLTENRKLISFIGFDNAKRIFPAVHSDTPFALVTLGDGDEDIELMHYVLSIEQLSDRRRRYVLTVDDLNLMNPNTRTCPIFRSRHDLLLARKLYKSAPVLILESVSTKDAWHVGIIQNFFSTSNEVDRRLFIPYADISEQARVVPVMRGTMIDQFDHRCATYSRDGFEESADRSPAYVPAADKYLPADEVENRLAERGWSRRWLMGWRDITNATNKRTVIASVFPIVGADDTLSLILPHVEDPRLASCLLANLDSLVLDYVAQMKVGGTHVRKYVLAQLPVVEQGRYRENDIEYISSRVLELTYTAHDLKPWAEDLGFDGPPFPWNPERRAMLRAELDAYYARLYGLTRDELRYILDPADVMGADYPSETFRVLKNNEIKQFGEYRTQRLVLEAWDKLD